MASRRMTFQTRPVNLATCARGPVACVEVGDCAPVQPPPNCVDCPPDFEPASAHIFDLDDPAFDYTVPMLPINQPGLVGYSRLFDAGAPLGGRVFAIGVGCRLSIPQDNVPPGAYDAAGILWKVQPGSVISFGMSRIYPSSCTFANDYGLMDIVPGFQDRRIRLVISKP